MTNKTILLLVAVMVCLSQPVKAEKEPTSLIVRGMTDCGSWLKHRKLSNATVFNRMDIASVEFGLLGFLSGLAIVNKATVVETDADGNSAFWIKNGVQLTNDQVYLWMDNFCRENPLERMFSGALKLYRSRVNK